MHTWELTAQIQERPAQRKGGNKRHRCGNSDNSSQQHPECVSSYLSRPKGLRLVESDGAARLLALGYRGLGDEMNDTDPLTSLSLFSSTGWNREQGCYPQAERSLKSLNISLLYL